MTMTERNEIFARDVLTVQDFMELTGMSYQTAAAKIRDIKRYLWLANRKQPRDERRGRLHVQDYLDYYRLPDPRNYGKEESS